MILNLMCGQRQAADIKENAVDPSKDTLKTLPLAHSMYCRTAGQRGVNRQLEVCCIVRQLWTSARIVTPVYNICTPVKALEFQQVPRAFARAHTPKPASQEYQSQRDGLLSAPPGPQHTEDASARVATIGRLSQVGSRQSEAMVKEHGLHRVSGKAKCNTIMMRRSHSGRPLRKVSPQGVARTVCSVLCKAAFVCLLLGSCYITSHTMICTKCRPSQVCDAWSVGSCPSTVNNIVQLNLSCRGRFTSEAMCSAQAQPIAGSDSQLGSHLDVCCTAYHIWISAMIVASLSYISKHIGALCNQLVLRPFKSAHLTITDSKQTSPTIHVSSLPGPKSGGGIPCRSARTIILSAYFCIKGATGVKVAPPAVGGAEGGQAHSGLSVAPPKPYGNLHTKTALLQDSVHKTTKRSFKRACRRALLYGQASYKGSTITMNMVQPSWLDCSKVNRKGPSRSNERKGLRVFCWNSGGLASGQWDELLIHIDPNRWDILLIQETHWTESIDFVSGPWSCIASSAGRGSRAGVMIMIHQRLCHNGLLRAEHVMPGRLLRVRLPLPGKDLRHLQIICAYQKAWNSQQASSVVEQRSRFWDKLDTALASVPNRDVVILGGDLNVSIPAVTGTSGSGVSPSPKDGAPDVYDLIGIAKRHGLIFLNTWNGRGTPVHTFQFGKYRAQLDFVLCRVLQADGVARQARPWHRFQLSQGSESGAVHYPVHASIPVRKAEWHMRGPKSTSAFDKEAIIQAACNLPNQEAASVIQLRQLVKQDLQSVCHTSQLVQLPHIVSRACMQIFPARRGRQITEALWQNAGIVASVSNTWRLWRSMRAMAGRSLTSMFKKWNLLTQHLKARKQQRRLSQQARRQKLLGFVGQAVEAASKHDVRGLYEVVNKLSKPRNKRVALRGQNNELLSAVEEADLLADHFAQRFQATHEQDIALRQASWVTSGNIQIDDFALSQAYAAAPLRKAVPPGHPPSAVWRLLAQEIATTVSRVVNDEWADGKASVPKSWSDAFLVLLPKPNKSGAEPKHLRPIGLQDQVGKLTLQVLLAPYKDQIYRRTNMYPQFAYTPGRSYRGALYRVFQHCDLVRNLCRRHYRNLQARFEGCDVTKLVGGLQISVDLTQAFDQMPRWLLLKGMRQMELDEDFIGVTMRWITQSEYEIMHMGHVKRFSASRGVRQGCVASPLLWIIFVHLVCEELAGKIGYDRLCQILTLFADDIHGQWTFHSLAELEEALDVLALLFNTLQKFGMVVNASKSKAVLAVAGTQASQIKKRFIRIVDDSPHLKVNEKGLFIPLVDSFEYLGVMAGYKSFEDETVSHRLAKGKANYWRLATILRGKHALTARTRVQLWRSCVWTSISYGLDCTGLTPAGIALLETTVLRQVRAALSCPSHITHVSSQDLMQKYNMDLPQNMLRAQMARTVLPAAVCSEDLHCPGDWYQHVMLTLRPSCIKPVQQDAEVAVCPECGVTYASRKAMLVHASRAHKITISQTCARKFNRLKDATPGAPQCAHCYVSFTKNEGLKRHIELGRCRVLNDRANKQAATGSNWPCDQVSDEQPELKAEGSHRVIAVSSLPLGGIHGTDPDPNPDPAPNFQSAKPEEPAGSSVGKQVFVNRQDVQQALSVPRANGVHRIQNRKEIAQVCAVCGQWIVSQYKMKNHYINSHKQLHASFGVAATKLCASFSSPGSPCLHCGISSTAPSKHRTTCPVLWQFCLLHLQVVHHGGGGISFRAPAATSGESYDGSGGPSQQGGPASKDPKDGICEQRQGSQQWQQNVQAFLRGQRGIRGLSETFGQGSASTGNTAPDPQTRYVMGNVSGPQGSPRDDVQSGGRVEEPIRAEEDHAFSSGCLDIMPARSSAQHSDCSSGGVGPAQACRNAGLDAGRQVAISGLGQPGQVPKSGCEQAANGTQRSLELFGFARQADIAARDDQSISCHQAAHTAASGSDHVLAGSEFAVQGSRSGMESLGVDGRPLSSADDRTSAQEGHTAAWPAGGQHPESARVLQLRLNNRTNICYINSFVKAWLWTVCSAGHSEAHSFGNAVQAWRDVLFAKKPQFVPCLPSWRPILRHWQRVNSQHDVVEFAEHVFQYMQAPVMAGSWESRTLEGDAVRVWSSGSTNRALHIHLDDRPGQTVQMLVQGWSEQAMVHALTHVPKVLVLQIMRYHAAATGPIKLDVPILLDAQVTIPVFTHDVHTSGVVFKLQAVIQHHGATTNAGHYTATLIEDEGQYWMCDDGSVASPHPQLLDATLQNAYTLILTKHGAP